MNGILRHVKHIRPRNNTQPLCHIPDVEIEMNTDPCHEKAEKHEKQSKDVSETNEENIQAENRLQETDESLRRSALKRRMPLKYLDCYLYVP